MRRRFSPDKKQTIRNKEMTRREFIGGTAAFAAIPAFANKIEDVRGVLLHWGHNMWGESLPEGVTKITNGRICNDHVKFDDALWQ